jgi:hypothetical protein
MKLAQVYINTDIARAWREKKDGIDYILQAMGDLQVEEDWDE